MDKLADQAYVQDWASATEAFLNSPFGEDWPGGARNLKLISQTIQQMGLEDAADKTAALRDAYAEMKRSGLIFPSDAETEVAERAATEKAEAARESKAVEKFLATASPREILEASKPPRSSFYGDEKYDEANRAFMKSFSNTHSHNSALFGKG